MFWERRARKELMAYQALRLRRYEIKKLLEDMDSNVQVRTSHLDGMPRVKGGKSESSVESEAEWREETQLELQRELRNIDAEIKPIRRSLKALSPLEQQVIKYTYFNYTINEDQIASHLGITEFDLKEIKQNALYILGDLLLHERYGKRKVMDPYL